MLINFVFLKIKIIKLYNKIQVFFFFCKLEWVDIENFMYKLLNE